MCVQLGPILSFTEVIVTDDTGTNLKFIGEHSIAVYKSGGLQSIMTAKDDSSVCNKLLLWPSGHYKKLHNHVREALDSGKSIPDDIASMMKLLIACQPCNYGPDGNVKI